jgi:hypothetical protein
MQQSPCVQANVRHGRTLLLCQASGLLRKRLSFILGLCAKGDLKMSIVQAKSITVAGHVEWSAQLTTPGENVRIEVYTGNVIIEFPADDTTKRNTYATYLPLQIRDDGTAIIRRYGTGTDVPPSIVFAASVTPTGVSLKEDDTTFAVDGWKLEAKTQQFPGVSGEPPCLILSFDLAVRNGTMIRVGYSVTVTTPLSLNTGDIELKPTDGPH